MPSPSRAPTNFSSGGDPHVRQSSSTALSLSEESTNADRHELIRPGPLNTFKPCILPLRDISKIIKAKFEGFWQSYKQVDEDTQKMWYEEFQRKYKFILEHESEMKKRFDYKAAEIINQSLHRVRQHLDKGKWIPPDVRKQFDHVWSTLKWKEKAKKNSKNRRSSGGILHTGGSIPATEHIKRLKTSSHMEPNCWDLFRKIHTVKGDRSKWVSSKFEKIV